MPSLPALLGVGRIGIFVLQVLRIVDQHIGAAGERNQTRITANIAFRIRCIDDAFAIDSDPIDKDAVFWMGVASESRDREVFRSYVINFFPDIVVSTQEVLPPNSTVFSPGTG